MPRQQSSLRRSIAALVTALLAAAWAAGISIPADAAPIKGYLRIISITDEGTGLGGEVPNVRRSSDMVDVAGPVQNQQGPGGPAFDVVVGAFDRPPGDSNAQPIAVSKATTIALRASGPGILGGDNTTAVIPRDGFVATILGVTYSQFANGVMLSAAVKSGVELAPDAVPVEVALSAVDDDGTSTSLQDPGCSAPTKEVPNCGQLLLPKGAAGHVIMTVGSCKDLGCSTTGALVVTAIADLGALYTKTSPATLILACDKDLCRSTANGVPKIPVMYTFENTGSLTEESKPCPAKGVIGADQVACVDYVQSSRQNGDLYLYFLFTHDLRISI